MSHDENIATITEHLSDSALDLFKRSGMGEMDWYSLEDAGHAALWALCEVLRGYESPVWGNTGGRYGHSGGWLDLDAVSELSEKDIYTRPELADFSDPYVVWYLVRYAENHGEVDLLELADSVNEALNN